MERNRTRHSHRSSKKSRKKQQQLLQQQQQQEQQLQQQLMQQQYQQQQQQQQHHHQQQQHQQRHLGCSGQQVEPMHRSRARAHSAGDQNRVTELLIDLPQCKHPHHQPMNSGLATTSANHVGGRYDSTTQHYTSSQVGVRTLLIYI